MTEEKQGLNLINGWQFWTLADAYTAGPPPTYVIDGLFAHGTLNIVYGAPGSFKSMLLADAAVCIAVDLNWLPRDDEHPGFKVTQCPVLWIDFDNGPGRTKRRFAALGRAYALPEDIPLRMISMPELWLDASNSRHTEQLAQIIHQQEAKFVVVDNLSTVSGDIEENSSEMRQVMMNFRRLVRDTDVALVVVHHQRKSKSQAVGRAGDSLRGHSSIEANLDLALLVDRQGDSSFFTARSTKVRGPDVPAFRGRFIYAHKPDTRHLWTARFRGAASPAEREERQIDEKLREVLSEGESPKTELINRVAKELPSVSRAKVRARLETRIQADARPGTRIQDGAICQRERKQGQKRTKMISLRDGSSDGDEDES